MTRTVSVVLACLLLCAAGCRRPAGKQVPPRPGETAQELEAASEVIEQVSGGVVLLRVSVQGDGTTEHRTATGAVVGEGNQIVCRAEPLVMALSDETRPAFARWILAVVNPGTPAERAYDCAVLRESSDAGLALLSIQGEALAPVQFAEGVKRGDAVFTVSAARELGRLVVHAGIVRGVRESDGQRLLEHTAGGPLGAAGPLFDVDGRLAGLTTGETTSAGLQLALPADRLQSWLASPPSDEETPIQSGKHLGSLLRASEMVYSEAEDGGYILPFDNGVDVKVRQTDNLVSTSVDIGPYEAGWALEALRFNYSDPIGSVALGPDGRRMVWLARIPIDFATPEYLRYATSVGATQAKRWAGLRAGEDVISVDGLYPGGESEALMPRLEEAVAASGLPYEPSEHGFELRPEAGDALLVTIYSGMVWCYDYIGGMPGEDSEEQERIAEELLQRNWHCIAGRFSLDRYNDLLWEALVPIEHLQARHLTVIVNIGTRQVREVKAAYGVVPFNEDM